MHNPKVSTTIVLGAAFTFLNSATSLLDFKSQFWGYTFCVFTAILLLYGLALMAKLPFSWGRRLEAFKGLRFGGRMPLKDAVKLAYEEARAQKTIWAEAAERLNATKNPAGVLDYVATYFAMHVPIWGSRPPSDRLEEVPLDRAKNGSMVGGATRLILNDNARTEFINLEVAAKDMEKMLKLMGSN